MFALVCGLINVVPPAVFAQKKAAPVAAGVAAGEPIAATRRQAINGQPFHRPLDAERIRRWMQISSQCTMAEFQLFLEPFSADEAKLLAKMQKMQAPLVNRLHFAELRGVLRQQGLLSHAMEAKQAGGDLKHTTPPLENDLYGAYDCVFASVGPPNGSPRYGDVIIRLEDDVRENGWATPFSGMHFIFAIRHQDARAMLALLNSGKPLPTSVTDPLSLGFDDRLHFSHYVVTESAWETALAYQAILVLRNAETTGAAGQIRSRFASLLTAEDDDAFWSTFIPSREMGLTPEEDAARTPFGYLEGKFDDQLSIKNFTAIEVPAAQLATVRTWPEAQPYLHLIRAKGKDVE